MEKRGGRGGRQRRQEEGGDGAQEESQRGPKARSSGSPARRGRQRWRRMSVAVGRRREGGSAGIGWRRMKWRTSEPGRQANRLLRSRGLAGEEGQEGQEGYVAAGLPQSIENGTVGRRQQAVCLLCCGGAVFCRMTPCWQTGIRSSFIHGLACRAARLQRGSSGREPRQAAQQAGAGRGGARHGPPRRRATVIPP